MTHWAVIIYLGIILAGCAVVGIADSFSPKEIAARLRIAKCTLRFTQDVVVRDGKTLPLYARLKQASTIPTIVLPAQEELQVSVSFLLQTGYCLLCLRQSQSGGMTFVSVYSSLIIWMQILTSTRELKLLI